ncbi:NADPH-dependent FMN reductase [Actinocatenispora comari]|uniref:FMN reductase n=1 Tax=Actinocatenispora comari TaxID=2807577 RepID=A0A8J4AA88_9ACTN|nr:NAD(P)H-dependent oxidoreductase [Actinocatenispora comari]GIL25427.1 FMN reductase [Actinocatenispora comari]
MTRIAIIVGSTRPGRKARDVAEWIHSIAIRRTDAEFSIVDLLDAALPLLDEPIPPAAAQYRHDHTRRWATTVDQFDGYVFVTPEYNHSTSAALKNALDFVYAEWTNKAAGFVGYGVSGGTRAVEHLRLVMAELQVADVRGQVALSLWDDFSESGVVTPRPQQAEAAAAMLGQLVAWSTALRSVRVHQPVP